MRMWPRGHLAQALCGNMMRPLLHLLSIFLTLPSVALAGLVSILGHAIAKQSLLGFFGDLLDVVAWLIPWGLLAILVALLLLILGGLSIRFRWLAALCVAILAIGSTVVVLVLTDPSSYSTDQLPFFLPAVISASLAGWLAVTEFPGGKTRQTAA
jgi:hypothetical protein